MNVNQPDDMTPNLAALAREVAALPFAWPDAATRSRMRSRFEDALAAKTVAKHGWLGRGFLIAAALLALGASAAAASASRSPMDLVRDPGGVVRDITVYDDFAHHPTAIAATLAGLRRKVSDARILAVIEPRSNTMKLGVMKQALPDSLAAADRVYCYSGGIDWDAAAALAPLGDKAAVHDDLDRLIAAIAAAARPGDHILVMSNGGFGGIHDKLLQRLAA